MFISKEIQISTAGLYSQQLDFLTKTAISGKLIKSSEKEQHSDQGATPFLRLLIVNSD